MLLFFLIFIIFSVVFTILLLFILNKYKKYYKELEEFLQSEPYNDAKTTLRTIDINLKKMEYDIVDELKNENIFNDEKEKKLKSIKHDKEQFASIQINIEDKLLTLKKYKNKGLEYLKNKKIFKLYKNTLEIKKIKSQINKISEEVDKKSQKYINEIKEINNVLWNYRKIGKSIEKILFSWISIKNIPKEFKDEIIKKNDKIKKINEDLSTSLYNQKTKEAKNNFTKYKKELYNVYEFGNYIDSFVNHIFCYLPNLFEKIQNFYHLTQKRLDSSLEFLEINKYLENSSKLYKEITDNFFMFRINKTKALIKNYLNSLLNINLIINNEMRAFNFINDPFRIKQIDDFYNDISIKFINIEKEIQIALTIDHVYFNWLNEDLNKLRMILNDVSDLKTKIEREKKHADISNISKQYRYKSYVYLIKTFNEIYYNIENEINIFYSEGLNSRLKFNRIKKLLLSLNNSIKEYQIKLDDYEISLNKKIEDKRIKIDNKIASKSITENDLSISINELQKKVVSYINTVGKKILVIRLYSYINKNYSYRRWNNTQIHKKFTSSENYFLNGEYYNGLKLIVSTIERGEN